MSAITAKASRKMKKYAVLTREPRCFLGSFDFSWEQRKLGDIGETYTGLSGKTKADFGHGQARFVTYMNVFSNPISNPEMTEPIEIDPKQNEVEVGDVFFTTSSETPEEVGMSSVLLEKRGKTYLNSFCFGFRPSEIIDSYYLAYMLRSESARDKIILLAQGISRYNISKNKVMEIAVSLPSLDEQKLIGQYFRQLDNLITLHQRKCALIFSSFQALISMMFTTSTFSWEQRKLGDIGKARSGVGFPDADQGGLTGVPFFKVSDMNSDGNENEMTVANNYVTAEQIADHRWSPITELPAIFFAKVGAAVMLNRKRLCRFPFLLDNNTMAYSLSPTKWDADFAKALFGTVDLTSLVQVGALPSYNAGDVESMEIYLPSLLEQEQIGAYFKHLDNLITLHQRECISFTGRAGRLILTANKKRTTSSWEQRKLSEIADKVTEKNAGLQYVETFTNSAEFGIISQRDFFDHDIAKLGSLDGYYIVKTEDFVYNPRISTSAPVGPINRNKLGRTGVMSPLYTVFRPHDIDTTYLEYFFKCGYWHSFMNFNGDSGARSDRFSIRDNVFFQMPIPIPDIDEQRKIGELLTCLDNLITLHQRQTIVYAVIRSIRKVILAERQYFAPPMVRKSP